MRLRRNVSSQWWAFHRSGVGFLSKALGHLSSLCPSMPDHWKEILLPISVLYDQRKMAFSTSDVKECFTILLHTFWQSHTSYKQTPSPSLSSSTSPSPCLRPTSSHSPNPTSLLHLFLPPHHPSFPLPPPPSPSPPNFLLLLYPFVFVLLS